MEYDLAKWLHNTDNDEYAGRVLAHVAAIEADNERLRAALEKVFERSTEVYIIELTRAALEASNAGVFPEGK